MGSKRRPAGVGRRLSKPQTSRRTVAAAAAAEGTIAYGRRAAVRSAAWTEPSHQDQSYGNAVVVTSTGHHMRGARSKSRRRLREYLYGGSTSPDEASSTGMSSDEEEEEADDESSPSSGRLSNVARDARKRLSRTGSSFTQLSSAKASSTLLGASSSRGALLLSDDEAEECAAVAEQIREQAAINSQLVENSRRSPVHEQSSNDDCLFIPVRRKSLYTPGLATRSTSDILRKPPSPSPKSHMRRRADTLSPEEIDYYYNPSHPATSPLARLASLDLTPSEGGAPSSPFISSAPHLGGLERGLLRVTNGAASPAPSSLRSASDQLRLPVTKLFDDVSTHYSGATATLKEPMSPEQAVLDLEKAIEDHLSIHSDHVYPESLSTQSASELAEAYIAELDPRSILQTPAPPEVDDEEEEEDIAAVTWSPIPPLPASTYELSSGPQEDAFDKLNGTTASGQQSKRSSLPYSLQSGHTSPSAHSSARNSTIAKLDSGYHSTTSVEKIAFKTAAPAAIEPLAIDFSKLEPQRASETDDIHARVVAAWQVPRSPPQQALSRPAPPTRQTSSVPSETSSYSRSSKRLSRISLTPSRKDRRLSCAQPPPPVMAVIQLDPHDLDVASIPRVPSLMVKKHAKRLTTFPLLEHTFPSLDHTDLRRRSLSPANRVAAVPLRFPSPLPGTQKPLTGKRIVRRSSRMGSRRAPINTIRRKSVRRGQMTPAKPSAAAEHEFLTVENNNEVPRLQRGKSWRRSKSSPKRTEDEDVPVLSISDLGTVASSLGSGPYDTVTALGRRASRGRGQLRQQHPHQIVTSDSFHPHQMDLSTHSFHPHQIGLSHDDILDDEDDDAATAYLNKHRNFDMSQIFSSPATTTGANSNNTHPSERTSERTAEGSLRSARQGLDPFKPYRTSTPTQFSSTSSLKASGLLRPSGSIKATAAAGRARAANTQLHPLPSTSTSTSASGSGKGLPARLKPVKVDLDKDVPPVPSVPEGTKKSYGALQDGAAGSYQIPRKRVGSGPTGQRQSSASAATPSTSSGSAAAPAPATGGVSGGMAAVPGTQGRPRKKSFYDGIEAFSPPQPSWSNHVQPHTQMQVQMRTQAQGQVHGEASPYSQARHGQAQGHARGHSQSQVQWRASSAVPAPQPRPRTGYTAGYGEAYQQGNRAQSYGYGQNAQAYAHGRQSQNHGHAMGYAQGYGGPMARGFVSAH